MYIHTQIDTHTYTHLLSPCVKSLIIICAVLKMNKNHLQVCSKQKLMTPHPLPLNPPQTPLLLYGTPKRVSECVYSFHVQTLSAVKKSSSYSKVVFKSQKATHTHTYTLWISKICLTMDTKFKLSKVHFHRRQECYSFPRGCSFWLR